MGMDIYLYEVCQKGEDCKEIDITDANYEPISYPEWLDKYVVMKDEEFTSLEKIAIDNGHSLEEISSYGWTATGLNRIIFTDGIEITLPDEIIEQKYTYTKTLPMVGVRKVAYAGYGYIEDSFTEGNHPFADYEKMKDILPTFIWNPEDMDRLTHIFKDPSEWIRIKEKFKKEKEAGKDVFVGISW